MDYIYGMLWESYETYITENESASYYKYVWMLSLLGLAHQMYNTNQVHSTLDLELHENTFILGY